MTIRVPAGEYIPVNANLAVGPREQDRYRVGDIKTALRNGAWVGSIVGFNEQYGANTKDTESMAAMVEHLDEATEAIDSAYERFQVKRREFRSAINNEVASVSASANRMLTELGKIVAAADNVSRLFGSAEMISAIQNAERLATALKAISEVESHRLTFAVIDKSAAQPKG